VEARRAVAPKLLVRHITHLRRVGELLMPCVVWQSSMFAGQHSCRPGDVCGGVQLPQVWFEWLVMAVILIMPFQPLNSAVKAEENTFGLLTADSQLRALGNVDYSHCENFLESAA
jgi:hypothetical protein